MLNTLSIFSICMALIFLVYSIISYKKKSIIYAVKDGKEKLTVLKDDYYKMQLLFCVLIGVFSYRDIQLNKINDI